MWSKIKYTVVTIPGHQKPELSLPLSVSARLILMKWCIFICLRHLIYKWCRQLYITDAWSLILLCLIPKGTLYFLMKYEGLGKKQMKTIWLLLWFIVLCSSRWFWSAMLSFEAIDCNGFCFIKYKETSLYLSCAQSSNKNNNIKTTKLSSIVSGLPLSHYLNCSVSRNVDSVKQNNSQIFLPGGTIFFRYHCAEGSVHLLMEERLTNWAN